MHASFHDWTYISEEHWFHNRLRTLSVIRLDLYWLPLQYRVHFKPNSHHEQLPCCSCTRVPDRVLSLRDIPARCRSHNPARVQILVPRFRKERSRLIQSKNQKVFIAQTKWSKKRKQVQTIIKMCIKQSLWNQTKQAYKPWSRTRNVVICRMFILACRYSWHLKSKYYIQTDSVYFIWNWKG